MFISLCKKIKQQLKAKKAWRQVLAYGILAFLIMQCYVLPFASENTEAWESVATIGDATWTNALPQDIQADAEESAFTESEETVQSVSPSAYYQAPDTSNAFVAYAMTIPKGSGKNSDNRCAIYVAQDIIGLSALMTTTMMRMKDAVEYVRANNLPYKVIIGGAVVSQNFADEIGADGYSKDANEAVKLVDKLLTDK